MWVCWSVCVWGGYCNSGLHLSYSSVGIALWNVELLLLLLFLFVPVRLLLPLLSPLPSPPPPPPPSLAKRTNYFRMFVLTTDPRMTDLIHVFRWGNDSAGENDRGPQSAGNRYCLHCRQRPANVMTFDCHHQTLCHVCVHQVEDCPRCHLPIGTFCRLDL